MWISPKMLALFLAAIGVHKPKPVPKPDPAPPMHTALASWYDDSGQTASGRHYHYGYASLMFGSAWGHVVEFVYAGRTVRGTLDDHGPYIGGRSFDLNWNLKTALGCPDLCIVRWGSP